jgi:hypothetical protein
MINEQDFKKKIRPIINQECEATIMKIIKDKA